MPHSSSAHYPHSTIESTGHSLTGHASTLHSTASSAAGTSLPTHSLGSIGSGTAGALQGHIGGVSGHIGTMANRVGSGGDNLVTNSSRMRTTDEDHANQFALIHVGPSRTTVGDAGRMHVGDQSGLEQLHAGATPRPPRPIGPRMGNPNGVGGDDWPSAPHQPPPPATPVVVPEESHHHMGGELKPGGGRRPRPSVVGGHVADADYDPSYTPDPANPWKPPSHIPPTANTHGHGVGVPPGPHATAPNGVYGVHGVPISDGHGGTLNNAAGVPVNKPVSTMFPQGVPSGQVWGMGEQAWNGGNPAHTAPPPGGGPWEGHAQVPFTPAYNPHNDPALPPHGSGDGNSPYAGHTVNVAGYSRPMVPHNLTVHPATYFPNPEHPPPGYVPGNFPTPGQPPAPAPFPYDNTPPRDYGDPNYPAP